MLLSYVSKSFLEFIAYLSAHGRYEDHFTENRRFRRIPGNAAAESGSA